PGRERPPPLPRRVDHAQGPAGFQEAALVVSQGRSRGLHPPGSRQGRLSRPIRSTGRALGLTGALLRFLTGSRFRLPMLGALRRILIAGLMIDTGLAQMDSVLNV